MKNCICLLSNFVSKYPMQLINNLFHDCPDIKLYILSDRSDIQSDLVINFNWGEFDQDYLLNNYGRQYVGNCIFPLLKLYNLHPEYDTYTFIEDDIAYIGNYRELFDRMQISKYDVSIRSLKMINDDEWYWTKYTDYNIPTEKPYHTTLQLYSLSNRALKCLDEEYKSRYWIGHHELLVPSILMFHNELSKYLYNNEICCFIYSEQTKIDDIVNMIKDDKFKPGCIYHPIKSLKFYNEHI